MKHWYNNGTISKFCEDCPEGFTPGRIKKQTAVEQRNSLAIQTVLTSYTTQQVIDTYIKNSASECVKIFNLSSTKQLVKLLNLCNYDFSGNLPSRTKGKPSVRSHESYVLGGSKSAETQQKAWLNKTEEERQAWANKMSTSHLTAHYKELKSEQNRQKWFARSAEEQAEINKKRSESMKKVVANLSEQDFSAWVANKFKIYQFDGIAFDSFPELAYYLYMKSNGYSISRNTNRLEYYFNDEKHYYFPDFEVNGRLVEIKGDHLFEQMQIPNTLDNAKYKCMLDHKVEILTSKDYAQFEKWFYDSGYRKKDFETKEAQNETLV